MNDLQQLAESNLQSDGFNLLDVRTGFTVADKLGFGGERDTILVWNSPPSTEIEDFRRLEQRLLKEFEATIPQYPNAKYLLLAHTLEGFSRDFRAEAARLRVRLRVPIQFFDAPFKLEEAPEVASAIKGLRDRIFLSKRVPQPYSLLVGGNVARKGEDLVGDLLQEFNRPSETSCLRIVVGGAGAGKSVFFRALFSFLYDQFLKEKQRQVVFARPVPLIPDYLRDTTVLRTHELIENFLRTDVAAPVRRPTFEWMLVNGFGSWLFDGLDELYAGDPEFFDYLLDLLTRRNSRSQILICARNSLLTSCDAFARFLDEFQPGTEGEVKVYQLNDWEDSSKRTFAWVNLEERLPKADEPDSSRVKQFLESISRSSSLKSLSGVPYYCDLLLTEYKQGNLKEFSDDFSLIDQVVSGMIKREIDKGLLSVGHFERDGLTEWLETLASESYQNNFRGLARAEMEEYAQLILRTELSRQERRDAITSLIQFPLFAPGAQPGMVAFKHELIAEFLAGRYLLKRVVSNPSWVAKALGTRIDISDSLILRYMASGIGTKEGGMGAVINALKSEALADNAFANLLQLLCFSTPAQDILRAVGVVLEGKDLRYVQFSKKDLRNVSFRNCDLSNTVFKGCDLRGTQFEGAVLEGTRFDQLSPDSLIGAHFGNLGRFHHVYVDRQRIDDLSKMTNWIKQATQLTEEMHEPCPAAQQIRTLFLKFVRPTGTARRDEFHRDVLCRGKLHLGAPSPGDCIDACLRFGYLQKSDRPNWVKRAPGSAYTELVEFARDLKLSTGMRQLLNALCRARNCEHV